MSDLRLFIAYGLPPEIRDALAAFQKELRRFPGDVKWEPPEKLHATIRFLGQTSPSLGVRVRESLREVAAAASPFELGVEGFGAFPSMRDPRVFWIGCTDPAGALEALAASIGRAMTRLGYPPDDKPFMPHITLGRVRKAVPPPHEAPWWSQTHLTREVKCFTFSPRQTVIGGFFLMESLLRPSGSEYRSVEEFSLTSGGSWAQNEGRGG